MSATYQRISEKNAPFVVAKRTCDKCGYIALSSCELDCHLDYGHYLPYHEFGNMSYHCIFCNHVFKLQGQFADHMSKEHGRMAKFQSPAFYQCAFCNYDGRCPKSLAKHQVGCGFRYNLIRHQQPKAEDVPAIFQSTFCLDSTPGPVTVNHYQSIFVQDVAPQQHITFQRPVVSVASPLIFQKPVGSVNSPLIASQFAAGVTVRNMLNVVQAAVQRPATQPAFLMISRPAVPLPKVPVATPITPGGIPLAMAVVTNPSHSGLTRLTPLSEINRLPAPLLVTSISSYAPQQVSSNATSVCEICGSKLGSTTSLYLHLRNCHRCLVSDLTFNGPENERFAGCSYCPSRFFSNMGLSRHVRLVHLGNPVGYRCGWCGRCTSADILDHLYKQHNWNLLMMMEKKTCAICPLKFVEVCELHSHMHAHHPELFPSGSIFNEVFKKKSVGNERNSVTAVEHSTSAADALNKDVPSLPAQPSTAFDNTMKRQRPHKNQKASTDKSRRSAKMKRYKCKACRKRFMNKLLLMGHEKQPHKYQCHRCRMPFAVHPALLQHLKSQHATDHESCQLCNEKVQIGRPMIRHYKELHLRKCSVVIPR